MSSCMGDGLHASCRGTHLEAEVCWLAEMLARCPDVLEERLHCATYTQLAMPTSSTAIVCPGFGIMNWFLSPELTDCVPLLALVLCWLTSTYVPNWYVLTT